MRTWHYLKNGETLELRVEPCTGCGACVEVCPHGVFSIADGKARVRDRSACMECGACMKNCPVRAITVESGVGCAEAMIRQAITGSKTATCGCGGDGEASSCCCSGDEK